MTGELLAIIAPVFLAAAVGFVWTRLGYPYDTALITRLLTNVATPCLVFSRISDLSIDAGDFATMALISALAMAAFAVFGFIGIKAMNLPVRDSLPPILFPNCGNMGLALSLFAFGDVGLALGIAFFVVGATTQFTVSPMIASGKVSLMMILRLPLIYATLAAIIVLVFGLKVPAWLLNTTTLLGDFAIPVMLITLGVSLAGLQVSHLKGSLSVALMRLGIGFSTGLALIEIFALTGAEAGVTLIMCSMPAAVFNYLFAQRYGENAEQVAGTVILSTAISFVTLPFLLAYVLN
ncbi:MAG: AEC family transporter [Alphaproteobacteria bacterium]